MAGKIPTTDDLHETVLRMGEIEIDEQRAQADDAPRPQRDEIARRENLTVAAEIALAHQFFRAQRRVTGDLQAGQRGAMARLDHFDDQLAHVGFPAGTGRLPARTASR